MSSEIPDRSKFLPKDQSMQIAMGLGAYDRGKAIRAANELAKRQIEALRLYQPTPVQEQFHACRAKEILLQAGNQLGKSLAGFVEDARAVLGMDPHNKYPKRDGKLAIIGYKESHIALNVYRYLFRAGAFKIIRDKYTGEWRTFHPWVPEDQERIREAKPAPPLIPSRFIETIHWKSKAGQIFKSVRLTTGWDIYAFSSSATPDQGFQADLVHIDEDIINEGWYSESIARLTMRNGVLRWTALPHNENDALNRVAERAEIEKAEHERGGPEPTTVCIRATIFDNPYMTEETRQENIKRWKAIGEDEYRKRALGELVTDTVRMYPTFSKDVHGIQAYANSHASLLKKYLDTREWPSDWCVRLYVDPGFDTAAGLFIATLPCEYPLHVIVNEVYIRQNTPQMFADAVSRILKGRWLQSMVMDAHGGALTSVATGERPQDVYESHMARVGVTSVETKHRFKPGCDNISYRETCVREKLTVRASGIPELIYDPETCPNFEMEMIRFRKLKVNGVVIDKGNRRARTHTVDCVEYACADDMYYKQPPARKSKETPGELRAKRFFEKKKRRRKADPSRDPGMVGGFVL